MAYHYDFTPGVERDLEGLDSHIRKRILKRLKWFADNAENVRHETLGGSQSDFFKLRVGDYRILYDLIESDQLLRIFQIDHRSNIYRTK